MSMLSNYFRVAIRNLLRHKVYSAINIAGLAIGMACCMIISLWVYYHLSFDRFHKNADRIYRIILNVSFKGQSPLDYCGSFGLMGRDLMNDYPEVVNYARLFKWGEQILVRDGDRKIVIPVLCYSDPSLFDLFSFEFAAGDPKNALSEPKSLVLTEETARKLFGDENPLGRVLELGGEPDYKVTGILKNIPGNSHLQFDMLTPFKSEWLSNWLGSYQSGADFYTYLLLEHGVDYKALERKANGFFQKHAPDYAGSLTMYLQPLGDIHLHSRTLTYDLNWRKTDITYIYIFSTIAFLILLVACINFVNLATSRSAGRAREVGIRKVVGARRSQLILQFLGESVLVSFCAMILARAFIELALPALNNFFGNELDFNLSNAWLFLAGLVCLTVFVGILAGWYPALFMSSPQPHDVLKSAGQRATRGLGLRRTLVISQFTVSIILIVCSIFIGKQLHWIQKRNLGFNKEHVIVLKISQAIKGKYESVRQELLENSSITDISALGPHKLGSLLRGMNFNFEGKTPDQTWLTSCMAVDPDFVRFYGLEIVEGRSFSPELATETGGAYIINETLKEKLGWKTAVGKKFWLADDKVPGQVIGVVKDFNFYSLHHKIEPLALFIRPELFSFLSVKVRPENIAGTLKYLERKWAGYDPTSPFEYTFLDEDFARLYQAEEMTRKVVGAFSILAVFVACLGLLGLISFAAESRTKEIGIRKVLGASVTDILLLLSKEFLVLLSLSILIAWPVAWYVMNRWLQNFAYRIDLGWATFLLGGVIALVIAGLTVGYQALKAATANPVDALRYE
jgi:putative ABC transport system permease protein